jgi:lipid-A-disaccharide synthase-like uncharacterized protein
MDWLTQLLFPGGEFLGIKWGFWKAVGWLGNVVFFSRFLVQWYATEKLKRVVVPSAFWWLSLTGALLLFSYALFYQRDSVFIFAYAFTWIPYTRNLIIHRRHKRSHSICPVCGKSCPPESNFCWSCGASLVPDSLGNAQAT